MSPLVSVIIPLYNEEIEQANDAIHSILSQSYSNKEVIVIFDNPENIDLKSAITSRFGECVGIIENETNIGLPLSLNKAIKKSKGKYIVRMDGDDISIDDRISKQVSFMEKNLEIVLSGMQAITIDINGREIGEYIKPVSFESIKKYARFASPVLHPTWIVRRSVFDVIGFYDNVTPAQDYLFISRLIKSGYSIGNIDDFGIKYRVSEVSVSHSNPLKLLRHTNLIRQYFSGNIEKNDLLDKITLAGNMTPKKKKMGMILMRKRSRFITLLKAPNIMIRLYGLLGLFVLSIISRDILIDNYNLFLMKKI